MKRKRGITPSPKYSFAGGLVTSMSKTKLLPNQLTKAKNINLTINGEAEVRGGCAKVSTVAFGETIDRFIHFKTDTYDKIIAYGGQNLKRLDVGTPDVWTPLNSAMPDTEDFRSMEIADDMLYVGATDSRPRVYYPGQAGVWLAGITAPGTKPTVADGGTGNLSGIYRWYHTYYNSTSGWESDPSPISDELTLVSKKATISAFVASTEAGVDKINIYRNSDGVQQYFYVGQKTNDTNSFEDNIADDNLGDEISFRYGLPPKSAILLYHLNRVFYVNSDYPSRLMYSEPLKPHAVYKDNYQDIEVGDGGVIIAIAPSYDNIVVVKNTGIFTYIFNKLDPTNSEYIPVTVDYGGGSPMSVDNIGEDVILLTAEGLKLIKNAGTTIEDVEVVIPTESGFRSFPPITTIFRDCKKAVVSKAVGNYYEEKDQYHISIPYYSNDNDLTVVWHRAAKIFSVHEGWNIKASALYREYDNKLLYRSHGDQFIYRHDYGNDDNGSPIEFEIQNGWNDVNGIPDYKKIRLFFPTIYGEDDAVLSYEVLKNFETAGDPKSITHEGASYWGYAHWGQNYWGASGENTYRRRAFVKGRNFSVRFYGSTTKKLGISEYQFFFQPKGL